MSELLENVYQLKYSGEQIDELLDAASNVPDFGQFKTDVNAALKTKVSRKVIKAQLPSRHTTVNGWNSTNNGTIWTYALPADGATTETTPHIVPINIMPSNYSSKMAAWNKITRASTSTDYIHFYCYDGIPETTIDIQIEYFVTE